MKTNAAIKTIWSQIEDIYRHYLNKKFDYKLADLYDDDKSLLFWDEMKKTYIDCQALMKTLKFVHHTEQIKKNLQQ